MFIGYARISTTDQQLHLQEDALKKADCEKIFTDVASGSKAERKGLTEALEFVRKGDTLVVWKLDRLGRLIRHLLETVNQLQNHGIGFKSLQENIDTTTSGGKLVFHLFSALAEFERDIIRERTQAGLQAARRRGRLGGRRRVMDAKKIEMAKALLQNRDLSIGEICRTLKVSRATLYRYLNGDKQGQEAIPQFD